MDAVTPTKYDPKTFKGLTFQNAVAAFSIAKCKFLVVSFTTDWRFSPSRSQEIVEALIAAKKNVTYMEIKADEGHDAFLLPIPRYFQTISAYMKGIDTS